MKKLIVLIFALITTITAFACSGKENNDHSLTSQSAISYSKESESIKSAETSISSESVKPSSVSSKDSESITSESTSISSESIKQSSSQEFSSLEQFSSSGEKPSVSSNISSATSSVSSIKLSSDTNVVVNKVCGQSVTSNKVILTEEQYKELANATDLKSKLTLF